MDSKELKALALELQDLIIPVGSIMCFASKNVPSNYVPCDGRELMISQYPKLYELLGRTFGEPESELGFLIPDLRGKFVRGWDDSSEIDPEREFGSYQEDAFQGHSHNFKCDSLEMDNQGGHDHDLYWAYREVRDTSSFDSNNHHTWMSIPYEDRKYWSESNLKTVDGSTVEGNHKHNISIKDNQIVVGEPIDSISGSTRNKVGTETRPKNIALLFCIKAL